MQQNRLNLCINNKSYIQTDEPDCLNDQSGDRIIDQLPGTTWYQVIDYHMAYYLFINNIHIHYKSV